jgi:hypothetical protein
MFPFIGPEMIAALLGRNPNESTKGSRNPRHDNRPAATERSGPGNSGKQEARLRDRPRRLIHIKMLIIDFYLWLDLRM